MLKISSIGNMPQEKFKFINDELQLKYNIHPYKDDLYEFSQEIYYKNNEIIPYLLSQINSLSYIVFELFKYINVNEDSKNLIIKEFIEQWKHNGLKDDQFNLLVSMLNKNERTYINNDKLIQNMEDSIDMEDSTDEDLNK